MKTTVKLSATRSIVVDPIASGVMINMIERVPTGEYITCLSVLTPDQCGALIFALEQACEVRTIATNKG